jgi:hypothetical protein
MSSLAHPPQKGRAMKHSGLRAALLAFSLSACLPSATEHGAVLTVHNDLEAMRRRMRLPEGVVSVRYVGGAQGTLSRVPGPSDLWVEAFFELDEHAFATLQAPGAASIPRDPVSVRADIAALILPSGAVSLSKGTTPVRLEAGAIQYAVYRAWAISPWRVDAAYTVGRGLYVKLSAH